MKPIFSHITLQTGHIMKQRRSMVAHDVVAFSGDLLRRALSGGHPALPFDNGKWLLTAASSEGTLVSTLWAGPWKSRVALLTSGVALNPLSGLHLWQALHETAGHLATDPKRPPKVPWIADRIEPGIVNHVEAVAWTADFARSLAWAWFERQGKDM